MSTERRIEHEAQIRRVESLEKLGLLIGYLSQALARYGRFWIEVPDRPIVICSFDHPKHKVSFEVQKSEIDDCPRELLLEFSNRLIEKHLVLTLNAIEKDDLPDSTGTFIGAKGL